MIRLAAVIAAGLASRMIHTGFILFDKYLGDALYAVMVYVILGLVWKAPLRQRAIAAMAIMTALEFFQLTLIPQHMLSSPHLAVRLLARLLGTVFSFLDLATYAVGIGTVWWVDSKKAKGPRREGVAL